MEIIDQV